MRRTRDADERVRLLGQLDLGAAIEVMTGEHLWSVQQRIATSISRYRAKVAVPSCNASGKTYLAARIAIAFYNAYTPGAPCLQCDPDGTSGGCRGSKVITTSSKETHLRDNLWGEIRASWPKIKERGLYVPGHLYEGDLRLVDDTSHFIIGQSAASAEGMQGYHAAHKLIIGDEATSVDDEVQLAITRLLASSDSRILLIYNPTTPDTYASQMARSGSFETIRITAWDTPAFTGELMPPGANLITPEFLRDLERQGMGPGTFEWVTSIEARDWDLGDDLLIPTAWYDLAAKDRVPLLGTGTRQLGVDLAAYGSDENVIVVRDGIQVVDVRTFPSMRTDTYVQGPVTAAVLDYSPHILVYDADGVGAGAVGYFDDLTTAAPSLQVIGFRGGKGHPGRFLNQRSASYWALRRRFQNQGIHIAVSDDKLREQLTDIHYTVTPQGDIRVETKQEMRKRGVSSPDRADATMYAFAFAEELAATTTGRRETLAEQLGIPDHSEEAMWRSLTDRYPKRDVNPVLGVPDDW